MMCDCDLNHPNRCCVTDCEGSGDYDVIGVNKRTMDTIHVLCREHLSILQRGGEFRLKNGTVIKLL